MSQISSTIATQTKQTELEAQITEAEHRLNTHNEKLKALEAQLDFLRECAATLTLHRDGLIPKYTDDIIRKLEYAISRSK